MVFGLRSIYEVLHIDSPVAMVIISIAFMLFAGFLMTRITKLLKLPNVTAYIVAGILIGPFCLNLVSKNVATGMEFLADIALAFIAFSTGEFFKFSTLKKNGGKVTIITVFEALMASILVFIVCFLILRLSLTFSIVLAALAAATAPASTMMTIRQTGARGDFVDTLLQVVAFDDVVGLIAYSAAISVALAVNSGHFNAWNVAKPLLLNILVFGLGLLFGWLLKILMPKKRSTDNRLIISIAVIFTFCGICTLFDVSPLLGCMSMGTMYINLTNDDKLFKQLNYFSPPILLLFFVRSGVNFDLNALFKPSKAMGSSPLLVIGITYFFVRIIGKYLGAFLGCAITKKDKRVRNYLGLALIPQAGVAIGLAALGARTIGGEIGDALLTIILASSILYELVGPVSAKLSLYLSKSYGPGVSDQPLEEVENVVVNGKKVLPRELLISEIQEIQKELPTANIYHDSLSEEEAAFLEAAEDQYNAFHTRRKR